MEEQILSILSLCKGALEAASRAHPEARALLVTLDSTPPSRPLPAPLVWRPAAAWLLEEDG
jgi:hypothetical protein